jgi:DNA-directed RNA polymerase specialized sigma24 family protein
VQTRDIFLALTFFAERPGDEIAGELQISTANVRVLRHRALADLDLWLGRRAAAE